MSYATENSKIDALSTAMELIFEEFKETKSLEVAAAGHVLSSLIIRHLQKLEAELDKVLEDKQ